MPIVASFTTDLNPQQYDEIWRQLREASADHPAGRLSHVGFEKDGVMRVVDVWDSIESFQAFGATLMPIIASVGGNVEPEITEARHFQTG
jgi:hypothetical protein